MTTLDIRNYADVEITSLYQWDEHRTIRIHGITIAGNVVYKLHFSNRRSFASLVVVPTEDEGVLVAEIPIQMLQRPCAIAVYLYGENMESNERMTLGEATITVVPRAMPEDEAEQHEDGLLAVPDGFVMKDGKLYLARGGMEFGEGATVGGGGDRVSADAAMSGTQVSVGYEGIADYIPSNKWNCWQDTEESKATASVVAQPTANCILLACVMHRDDDVEISGDGWTKVVESVPATPDGVPVQWITIWSKSVPRGTYTVTVTQNTSTRMAVKVAALYEASSLSVIDNLAVASVPYSPSAATGKRRLYLNSSVYAYRDGGGVWKNANIIYDSGGLDLMHADTTRFSIFYDYQPEREVTPSFTFDGDSYPSTSINLVTLDITEVQ